MHSASSCRRFRLFLLTSALLATTAFGASFSFSGLLTPGPASGTSWVDGNVMPTALEFGSGTATTQSGFSYFTSRDIGLLTFQFADLELNNFQAPGPSPDQWGFMYFSEGDGNIIPFSLSYNGVVIATGTTDYINLMVENDTDLGASGDGRVTLTTPGSDPTFFNEFMSRTGGSGRMNLYLSADAVPNGGTMAMGGTFVTSAVPELEDYALFGGAGVLLWATGRRFGVARGIRKTETSRL